MTGDMPMMFDAAHAHTVYGLANMGIPTSTVAATTTANVFRNTIGGAGVGALVAIDADLAPLLKKAFPNPRLPLPPNIQEKPMGRRLVQVLIADTDENVPLEMSMLYTGEQKLTDSTDQELFFEIDLKVIMEKHNVERVKLINKKVKERTENLDPVKIRDLKMVVVNVATF